MMEQIVLFGLYLAPLFNAIAKVESDCGVTSKNIYQISDIYIDDLNRIYPHIYPKRCKYDKYASQCMMFDYWRFYAYDYARKTKKPITYEVLARIHNGGPNGMFKATTIPYWHKVKKELKKELERIKQ